ncbi:uncharacterized protein LOC123936840 [Meles meles]|uniref:uncharacterized protein LOC123936840 n=1 Tax=Meles meles TaxID=9662 RepID=UPI001E6A01CF|nr:uncharacterized protein LOC123936840 [Meles meles]
MYARQGSEKEGAQRRHTTSERSTHHTRVLDACFCSRRLPHPIPGSGNRLSGSRDRMGPEGGVARSPRSGSESAPGDVRLAESPRLTLGFALALNLRRQLRAPRRSPVLLLRLAGRPPPLARGTHLSSAAVEPVRRPKSALGLSHGQLRGEPAAGGACFGAPRGRRVRQGMRAPTETRQWWRLVTALAPGTLQAGGLANSPAEGRSRRRSRSRRRGRRRPGPEGESAGQRRIASAHCCPARSGAALRPDGSVYRKSPSGPTAPRLLVSVQEEGTRVARRVGRVEVCAILRLWRTWDVLSTPYPLLGKGPCELQPTSFRTLSPRVPGAVLLPGGSAQFPPPPVTNLWCGCSLRRPGGQRRHPPELTPPPDRDARGQTAGA